METDASLLRCNSETGSYIPCFWVCVKLQSYWSIIVDELRFIFGVQIELDHMCPLICHPDGEIKKIKHKRLFKLLTFAARKNILLFLDQGCCFFKKLWHNLIIQHVLNEYIICMLHSSVDAFCKVWDPYLKYSLLFHLSYYRVSWMGLPSLCRFPGICL